jgi:Multiubiquitin
VSEHEHEITIHIDRKQFKVDAKELTGAQLRQLPHPLIGPDYDLYLEVPGGEDELIADDKEVKLKECMHFFSTQRHITPGA